MQIRNITGSAGISRNSFFIFFFCFLLSLAVSIRTRSMERKRRKNSIAIKLRSFLSNVFVFGTPHHTAPVHIEIGCLSVLQSSDKQIIKFISEKFIGRCDPIMLLLTKNKNVTCALLGTFQVIELTSALAANLIENFCCFLSCFRFVHEY